MRPSATLCHVRLGWPQKKRQRDWYPLVKENSAWLIQQPQKLGSVGSQIWCYCTVILSVIVLLLGSKVYPEESKGKCITYVFYVMLKASSSANAKSRLAKSYCLFFYWDKCRTKCNHNLTWMWQIAANYLINGGICRWFRSIMPLIMVLWANIRRANPLDQCPVKARSWGQTSTISSILRAHKVQKQSCIFRIVWRNEHIFLLR